ncbi:hypothetical protein MP638_000420 [Amoeboaphelidium occidentale]|nr:hypothetical protein MP638_000420 [Amoeboaphelidium occidentale]
MSKKSPTTSSKSSIYSIHDPTGYIAPSLQDMLGVEYLSTTESFPGVFPVICTIHGLNNRLMVNLVCKRSSAKAVPVNVIFLIHTGSPSTFLSSQAMEALIGRPGCNVGRSLDIEIHSDVVINCHLSPPDKHFADVNVLGTDFMVKNNLSLVANYRKTKCALGSFEWTFGEISE